MHKRSTSTTSRSAGRAENQPRRESRIRFVLEGRDRDFRGIGRQALNSLTSWRNSHRLPA